MPPRGASGLSGILLVDKPLGPTSHDIVAAVRRLTGERRVGHAGTLDPLATGLLVVLVGPYTRLEPYLSCAHKSYRASIALGTQTDTDDAEGSVIMSSVIPDRLRSSTHAAEILSELEGPQLQEPPAFSAIKVHGQTAHKAARAGQPLTMAPRPVEIFRAEFVELQPDPLVWVADFEVSKGTYIRALARDIGRRNGTGAHLCGLRRTASGAFDLAQAHSMEEIEEASGRGCIASLFADACAGLELPLVEATVEEVAHGRPLVRPDGQPGRFAVTVAGRLGGVYHREGNLLKADVVFPEPLRGTT
ncbi:MAG: tRNA pseudouridine(55) synthase TruB [Coriobacteriia bacterium]|nr:tRNA pseudouridine(55) synthase TruB [Coriobacteriia bacterium]